MQFDLMLDLLVAKEVSSNKMFLFVSYYKILFAMNTNLNITNWW